MPNYPRWSILIQCSLRSSPLEQLPLSSSSAPSRSTPIRDRRSLAVLLLVRRLPTVTLLALLHPPPNSTLLPLALTTPPVPSPIINDQVYTFFNDRHDSPLSKQANPVLQPKNPQRLAPSVPKGTDPGDSHNHRQGTVPSVYDMVHGNSAALSRVIWPGLRGTGQGPSKPDINKMPSHVSWPGMPNIRQGMPSDVRVSGMDISHDMGLRPSDVRVSGKDISDDMVHRPSDVRWPVVNIHHPGGTMDPHSEDTVPSHASGGAHHLV
ncbi:hypothetical protein EV361DRAFT_282474 [Lentinula raphanica]|nr:hypothetical protein EV361DRAFT_282474 [Lentinula raphanica]